MATTNKDFLRFSAYSIKELITRKLSEDTKFTDQVYEGSNLAVLIDIFSYMAQMFLYSLNSAAAESMFSDTQYYENMNRLVKFIGYNPSGITPATAQFYIDNSYSDTETSATVGGKFRNNLILKYSAIDTGLFDANGNKVYYSTKVQHDITDDLNYNIQLYNGKWKLYNTVFTAAGTNFETFNLTAIGSDIENSKYVADNCIDVYVDHDGTITQWNKTDNELFLNNDASNIKSLSEIYKSTEKIYSIRLDENKNYEIKFGNGIIGSKLNAGDTIYIFYLDTNGYDGAITPDTYLNTAKFKHDASLFGITDDLYESIFGKSNISKSIASTDENPLVNLIESSTSATAEESVDDIRSNAPSWFKTGNRLITHDDYIYYVKNRHKDSVIDVICQNNWEYASTFLKWLYDLGMIKHNLPTYYLNQNKLIREDYIFADPADGNNIYLWTKLNNSNINTVKTDYVEDMQNIKTLTVEPIFLNPVNVNFAVCAAPEEKVLQYLTSDSFDENNETYIEITIADNSVYVNSAIQSEVETIINNFFLATNFTIGCTIDLNALVEKIYEIPGVERIRTIYYPYNESINSAHVRIFNGISFASWSSDYIDAGDDLIIGNASVTLKVFQFPTLFTKSLANKIKVIKKSVTTTNRVQY